MTALDDHPRRLATGDEELVGPLRGYALSELKSIRQQRLDEGRVELTIEDERRLVRSLVGRELGRLRNDALVEGNAIPEESADRALISRVQQIIFGMGQLQDLIDDQSLSEININGFDGVWLTYDDGRKVPGEPVMGSDEELIDWVRQQAVYSQENAKAWDPTNWKIQMSLPDGSRLVGVMNATPRPAISIRLNRRRNVTLDDLLRLGDYTEPLLHFLECLVDAKFNLVVSGPTGGGKTTLVRALCARISPDERLVTVEHFAELGLDTDHAAHPDVVRLTERLANGEGHGAISLEDEVETSRRLNPGRLIVGEVTGPEVIAFLDGMTQGNDGGITTIHARSARRVPERIAVYGIDVGLTWDSAMMLTSAAVDFIVHMDQRRNPDGTLTRWVSSIIEVIGYDGRQVLLSEVWGTPSGQTLARPAASVSQERADRLADVGWDSRTHIDLIGGLG